MKKICRKLVLISILFVAYLIFSSTKVEAASASITGSKTVTQGQSVTVTGSVTAGAWNLVLSGNGQSKGLVGQTSVVGNQSASTSITFTASNVGTYTFTLKGDITDFDTDATTYPNQTCTITVVAPATNNNSGDSSSGGSSNSGGGTSNNSGNTSTGAAPTLSNLGINPHDFSGFSAGKTSYTVNVPNDCTSINLYATSKNGTVSGTGNKTLKEGTNKFSVTVTNSNGSKTYTVSVVRATGEGEDVPNLVDEEPEEGSEGIGLQSLAIDGYDLNTEFKSDVFEYTVKIKEDLTIEKLNEIKEKLKAEANAENVNVDVIANIDENGKATITIIVKDDEKEYAKYVINFVKEETESEEEPEAVGAIVDTPSDNNKSGFDFSKISYRTKVLIALGIYLLTLFLAIWFAIVAYAKTKKVEEYENEYEFVDDDEETENIQRTEELDSLSDNSTSANIETAEKKLNKFDGYRNLRSAPEKNQGRHF